MEASTSATAGYASRLAPIIAAIAVLFAAGALAVAIAALEKKPKPAPTSTVGQSVAVLGRQLDGIKGQMTTLSTDLQHLQSRQTASAADETKLSQRLAKVLTCLPEMMGAINGLTANVSNGSVYLSNTQQVSSYCSPVIYGNPQRGG
jgi:conjugal transfer/entry exclusion protein